MSNNLKIIKICAYCKQEFIGVTNDFAEKDSIEMVIKGKIR